jgi:hypothetical protein
MLGGMSEPVTFLTSHAAGVHHHVKTKESLESLPMDTEFNLEPEPTNPHDKHAIRMMFRGHLVAYVPATLAPMLGAMLGGGYDVRCFVTAVEAHRSLVGVRYTIPNLRDGQ